MDNWQIVKKLFHEAIDFMPDERPNFLDSRGVDVETRREVENLLQAYDDSADFIAEPAIFNSGFMAHGNLEENENRIGEKIGNYSVQPPNVTPQRWRVFCCFSFLI